MVAGVQVNPARSNVRLTLFGRVDVLLTPEEARILAVELARQAKIVATQIAKDDEADRRRRFGT